MEINKLPIKERTLIRDNQAITVSHHTGYSQVYTQPINPHTGLPWQARRYIGSFQSSRHRTEAMALWLKKVTEAGK